MSRKKGKINFRELDIAVILALSHTNKNNYTEKDGWLEQKDIMKERNPETDKLFFTSPSTSLPQYIQRLISMGLVEKGIKKGVDNKKRKVKKHIWRLIPKHKIYTDIIRELTSWEAQLENRNDIKGKQEIWKLINLFQNSIYVEKLTKTKEYNVFLEQNNKKDGKIIENQYINAISNLLYTSSIYYDLKNNKEFIPFQERPKDELKMIKEDIESFFNEYNKKVLKKTKEDT